MESGTIGRLRERIRAVPDFPSPGVTFRDITPLLADAGALHAALEAMVAPYLSAGATLVAGMEARGFLFGAMAAYRLGVGFVPLRKAGRLPRAVESISYDLEYGAAALEVHLDAAGGADRVLLVDDLIATGGTARASVDLIHRLGARVIGSAFLIELDGLGGRSRMGTTRVHSVLRYGE